MSVIEPYFAQHTSCTLVVHPHLRAPPSFGWSRRILCSHIQFPFLGSMFHVSHDDIFLASKPILSESYPPGLSRTTLLSLSWITAPPCLIPKALFIPTPYKSPFSQCSVALQLCLDVSVDCKGLVWPTASMTPSASAPSVTAALAPYPDG